MPEEKPSRSTVGRIRVTIAWLCTLGAILWALLGLIDRRYIGMENYGNTFYIVAPPLVIAAIIHLYLVTKGTKAR